LFNISFRINNQYKYNPFLGGKVNKKEDKEEKKKFPLAPMGVLAPSLRTLNVSARPPSTQAEIFPPNVSAESHLKISPNPS
jgi:hypothetical protein